MDAKLLIDAEWIEEYRLLSGLMKRELAARAGIHPNLLAQIQRGEPVGPRVARKLAKAVGKRVPDIARVVRPDESKSVPATKCG